MLYPYKTMARNSHYLTSVRAKIIKWQRYKKVSEGKGQQAHFILEFYNLVTV
jgi:hypothetical protein